MIQLGQIKEKTICIAVLFVVTHVFSMLTLMEKLNNATSRRNVFLELRLFFFELCDNKYEIPTHVIIFCRVKVFIPVNLVIYSKVQIFSVWSRLPFC